MTQKHEPFGDQHDAWGNHLESKGWIGEREEETQLVYLNARYYDPEIGRFTVPDPIVTLGQGLNRYSYSWNNPINLADPSGHDPDDPTLVCPAEMQNCYEVDPPGGFWGGLIWDLFWGFGDRWAGRRAGNRPEGMPCEHYGFPCPSDRRPDEPAAPPPPPPPIPEPPKPHEDVFRDAVTPGQVRVTDTFSGWEVRYDGYDFNLNIGDWTVTIAPNVLGESACITNDKLDRASDGVWNPGPCYISGVVPLMSLIGPPGRLGLAARGATKIGPKVAKQMGPRGWTKEAIDEAVKSGKQIKAINKATGNPATWYVHPQTGQSVVVDNVTGEVIHVGGPGFRYGPGSGDLP